MQGRPGLHKWQDRDNSHDWAQRPAVLVFAGLDPGGGAGLAADITAINAMGAHAMPVITVLTAQDNDRVHKIQAVEPEWVRCQAQVLIDKIPVAAVKIGIIGSLANARMLVALIAQLREKQPDLPVVLDPVLASGHGDALAQEDPLAIIAPLLPWVSVILPNCPEAVRLSGLHDARQQAEWLLRQGCGAVLLKGGHAHDELDRASAIGPGPDGPTATESAHAAATQPGQVVNHWFDLHGEQRWSWPRLPGSFHGSGCTLAASLAAALALKLPDPALQAQAYTQQALAGAYAIAPGQLMPLRTRIWQQERT